MFDRPEHFLDVLSYQVAFQIDAVAGLAGRQRIAVELHQFEERTYTEVAADLDMTPKAAKSLLYRARNQLRSNLSELMNV